MAATKSLRGLEFGSMVASIPPSMRLLKCFSCVNGCGIPTVSEAQLFIVALPSAAMTRSEVRFESSINSFQHEVANMFY